YRHMTMNLAECINFILKGTHHFLIKSVVKNIFSLSALFPKRVEKYVGKIKGRHIWCEEVMKDIAENAQRANFMSAMCHSRPNLPQFF
ncbi:hypothetical protein J1N35_024754, partial [Gossypium stocksii]